MDIGDWLRQLGLERYEQAFRDNDVALRVLPELTDADLKELGLTLGHRRLLLKAIQGLEEAGLPPGADACAAPPPSSPATAERRQLTVMFVDLVGSTALAARLDPEDMGEVIRSYQEHCGQIVSRWGGHVAKYMGDGVLAYFGWPQAHEDDAERAVRSGLDLAKAVGRLTTSDGAPLSARVGIATGLVMVGDLVGEGAAQEQRVIGETPNLAARLQGLAEPGRVVIAEGTRRLLGGLFEYADLGRPALKGFPASVRAWRVLGETRAESRFEALHGEQLTALVGREHELALLVDRWERAKEGEGQVVLLSGEPGIGKSRIVRALREHLANERYMPLSHYCSPHHTNSALYPVINLLERASGFARDDRAEIRLDKLEALLAGGTEALVEAVPLIAALLGIETGERYPAPAVSPQRRKQRTLEVLVEQVEGLATREPVLAVYEDLHWMDPTTLEALDLLIERVQGHPVLVLITFRPEFSPPWTGYPHVMQLSLSRLSRRQGQALVEEVTGGKALPDEMLNQILAKTDGVPLFVEELTKTVLESGLLRDAGDRYTFAGALPPLAIPATLHDSLMARLDRLAPVKEVAQIGAVIGREFSYDLLAAVSPLPEAELDTALRQLVQAELIFRRGTLPSGTYAFKHALVRDAAYASLLKSKRRQIHARVASILEKIFAEAADSQPELIAQHYTEAGFFEKAVAFWHIAGERAIARSAYAEAITQLKQGLALLEHLPEDDARRLDELQICKTLGSAFILAKGYAAVETEDAFARARALCDRLNATSHLFPLMFGQWAVHLVRGEQEAASRIALELLQCAEGESDSTKRLIAHRTAGVSAWFLGQPTEALVHYKEVLTLYDPTLHHRLAAEYSYDASVSALEMSSLALFQLGYLDQAIENNAKAVVRAMELAHPASIGFALWHTCLFDHLRHDWSGLDQHTDRLIAFASEHGFPYWLAMATLFRGWLLALRGHLAEGIQEIESGIASVQSTGAGLLLPHCLALLARVERMANNHARSRSLLADALQLADQGGERWYMAELHRQLGEALLEGKDSDQVSSETCFQTSIEVARRQKARLWELRASVSLSRLWAQQDKRAPARDLLAPVHGWFTEGFDTPDLEDAKTLLGELS